MSTTLETLKFDNLVLRSLPLDPETENYVRQVSGACFSKLDPTPVDNPHTVAYSVAAMKLLDLPEEELKRDEFAAYFSGSKKLPGSETASHCYCGHQFGNFAGQLGDGAAIYLGEVLNNAGERWEIQIKGAGLTPYSRSADGRKVLRSSIREFLCSEAMHNLGIPTTRAGSCVTSDTKVIRDIFYDGHPKAERATIVMRMAQSFIRFGSFEITKETDPHTFRAGPSVGQTELTEKLLTYVIKTFYTEIWESHQDDKVTMYSEFYREVVQRTARLVADWQCVGWCHGVLNTDNMSILGLTIDYGPYGFMDSFNPDFICNGSDDGGRYTYAKQPEICKWNCEKLAESLKEFLPLQQSQSILHAEYTKTYNEHYMRNMRKKLGLVKDGQTEDKGLVKSLFDTMEKSGADFTNTFRALCELPLPGTEGFDEKLTTLKRELLGQCCTVEDLVANCRPMMHPQQLAMFMVIMNNNPALLNQVGVEQATITKAMRQVERREELKKLSPEKKREDDIKLWDEWLDQYLDRLQSEVEGVDGVQLQELSDRRMTSMKASNPKYILRNFVAQNAITAAEKGDFSEVRRVLRLLENPYSDDVQPGETTSILEEGASNQLDSSFVEKYTCRPDWARDLRVT